MSYLGSPVDSYLGIKKNEVPIHAPKRLNLRTIELSERRHIQYPADPSTVQGLVRNLQMTSSQLCISKVLPVPQLQILNICGSTSVDSTNCGSCRTMAFAIEKNIHLSVDPQFRLVLFKS